MTATDVVLEARGLTAGYGSEPVLHQIDLTVHSGEVLALLGPNGAGKTTTVLAIAGELPLRTGEVRIAGAVTRAPLHRRARAGLAYIPEGRSVFFGMSVRENLKAARIDPNDALELFPELEKRLEVAAGLLSGGEQQMLTLARALARRPRLVLADELSLGLAPLVVKRLLKALRAIADEGAAVLFVEQHARKALLYADNACVMRRGRITLQGTSQTMRNRIAEIEAEYLTTGGTSLQSVPEPT